MEGDNRSSVQTGNSGRTSVPDRWFNRNVVGMALTSFLSDAGHEMATATMAGFLGLIGAPAFALGVIEGVADAISSWIKLASGWWGDRIERRKPIVTAGYALTGGAFSLFAVASTWPLVLLGRMVAWLGRGIRGPLRDAMLAESIPAADRGKAFGFHRMADTLGAIAGPMVAAGLLVLLQPHAAADPTRPFRAVFWLTLIPGLGSAVAFALLVVEYKRGPSRQTPLWTSVRALPQRFRRFLVGVGAFGMGDFSHTLLILAATQLLAKSYGHVSAAQIGALLYALRNGVYAGVSYPIGVLGDRWGRRPLLVAGYALGGVTMAGFAVAFLVQTVSPAWLGILFGLSGIYIATEDSLERALTADLVPDESSRGTAYGVMGAVNGMGDLVSSVFVGLLWSLSPIAGFSYAATAMMLGGVLLWRVR